MRICFLGFLFHLPFAFISKDKNIIKLTIVNISVPEMRMWSILLIQSD